jgi:hypothetical protein
MEIMHLYVVTYLDGGGKEKQIMIRANTPGHAFAKCPGKPIKACKEGRFLDGIGFTEWKCPSTKGAEPMPGEKFVQELLDLT